MNAQWQSFLQSQGAPTGADGHAHFAAAPGTPPCRLYDLSHLGLITVAGDDTEHFLQGQLTNDVRELSEAHSQLSSHCSPKGRMLANFRLLRRGGTVYLQMPRENVAAILKRLSMFKLMAKVDVADASDTSVCIGVAGTAAENLLSAQTGKLPQDGNGAVVSGDFIIVRLPGETPRFQVLGPAESTIALWRALAADATPDHVDRWALEDIRAGLPMVFGPTVEAFVPQMTNMQLVDGLSFNKGCYTGQEVVARMQYLGKLKRRMYRARIDADTCPAPGAELVSSTSTSGQGTGRVVDARPAANGTCELLVVAEIAAVESNDVQLGDGGPALQFLDLPYAFEAPK